MSVKSCKTSYALEHESAVKEAIMMESPPTVLGLALKNALFALEKDTPALEIWKKIQEGDWLIHKQKNRITNFHFGIDICGKGLSWYLLTCPEAERSKHIHKLNSICDEMMAKYILDNLRMIGGEKADGLMLGYTHAYSMTSQGPNPHVHRDYEIANCLVKEGVYAVYAVRNAREVIFQQQKLIKSDIRMQFSEYLKSEGVNVTLHQDKLDVPIPKEMAQKLSTQSERLKAEIRERGGFVNPRERAEILQRLHAEQKREKYEKFGYPDLHAMRNDWLKVGKDHGVTPEQYKCETKKTTAEVIMDRIWDAKSAVDKALKDVEKKGSFTRDELLTKALKHGINLNTTAWEIKRVVEEYLKDKSIAGITSYKSVNKEQETEERFQSKESAEKERKTEERFHSKESAERERKTDRRIWREWFKEMKGEVKKVAREALKEAKRLAEVTGKAFDRVKFYTVTLPKALTKAALDTFRPKPTEMFVDAKDVNKLLLAHRRTPYGQSHWRAFLKVLQTGSLEKAERVFEKERTPLQRLDSGVALIIQDPENKLTDKQKRKLEKLARRDGCRLWIETPIKHREREKEREKDRERPPPPPPPPPQPKR